MTTSKQWRLGVVGSPIEHSLSPLLHEAGLARCGLRGSSTRVEMSLEQARAGALRGRLLDEFDALSVTAPLKGAALSICDELSEAARRTGSVNSLLVRDGAIHGASTDGEGFVRALRAVVGDVVADAHAVVLGAGGAARAIVDALVEHGVQSVVVHAQNEERAEALARAYPQVVTASVVYRPVDLVVNTLPPAVRRADRAVLQGVHRGTVAVDIAYEPRQSDWRTLYDQAGCRTMNGLAMLAYQAALQMNWWWGVTLEGADLLGALP